MVLTQSQDKNMSKEQLIQELTTDLSKKFNEFSSEYDKVYSELQ